MLSLTFSVEQVARYEQLATKVQDKLLTAEEKDEPNDFLTTETVLVALKAQRSLSPNSQSAA